MKTLIIAGTLLFFGVVAGCSTAVPKELVDAREAHRRASAGPAAEEAPAELHTASEALKRAEKSFEDDKGSYKTRDFAYVAQRKAQIAEATAAIAKERETQAQAKSEFERTQGTIVKNAKAELSDSRGELERSQQDAKTSAAGLAAEKEARKAAEAREAQAMAELAKLASVKDEQRGTVITLSGSVLFASNQTTLLPAAQSRLDQVAQVLMAHPERKLVIEGHTDSRGSDSANMNLSQRRADAVRTYLVSKQYEADLIEARGMGEGRPIADNKSAEGRANNRRVEIIIERDAS